MATVHARVTALEAHDLFANRQCDLPELFEDPAAIYSSRRALLVVVEQVASDCFEQVGVIRSVQFC